MSTHALDGSGRPIDLGDGYALTAPSVRGTATSTAVHPGARARGFAARAFAEELFDAQLESAGLAKVREIEVDATAAGGAAAGARGLDARDVEPPADVVLTVPTDPDEGAVVLLVDESGALTWHVPREAGARGAGARAFGAPTAPALTFALPVGPSAVGARGFGAIGKKLIKVFKYPAEKIEEGIGAIAAGFIRKWEAKHRPYLLCTYGPADYRAPKHDAFRLAPGDWARLAQGRALLFVHGTFSSCDAFHDLPQTVMDELSARYGGRLFALDHPTMAADPAENAEFLLGQLPAGTSLTVDIVCHSRGGLVAREIAARGAGRGLTVGRVVMVGVPNGGTSLADSDHMLHLVDRLTTVASILPSRAATVAVDALVAVVKCAAHALLDEMAGLRAMNPGGDYLRALNAAAAPATALYAVVSNFEPKPGTPLFSLARAADEGADRAVFDGAANDLVVPTQGGFAVSAAGFPVPDDRRFEFPTTAGVIHTDYFSHAETHAQLQRWLEPTVSRDLAAARAAGPSPAELDALRPHVVNLSDGVFSRRGELSTTRADVEALFARTLPDWLARQPAGAPRRVVFWAHGGLINEKDGIAIAAKHVEWWKANGVFPIYFVWETGLNDALGSLLATAARTARGVGARDLADFTDFVIEKGCRAARGDLIWGAMKSNAERASAAGGGALAVAKLLKKFCDEHAGDGVELHAVGHSAGSIFHAHFLNAAKREKVPGFRSLQLLAPAIRVDTFKERVLPLLDGYVDRLTMFSMTDDYERRDTCLGVYRKSLLYLIHRALERRDGEPILGLRVSAENDPELRRLFWGTEEAAPRAEAVWSVTTATSGAAAATSSTHGGFDDDGPTMTSVALRVLAPDGAADATTLANLRPYAGDARRGREWPLSEEVRLGVQAPERAAAFVAASRAAGRPPRPAAHPAAAGGKRYALCVGIDAYPAPYTLSGCVGDARAWGKLFRETLQFDDVQLLTNADATRAGIVDALGRLLARGRPGDTLVFQFSGHGTSLPDDDGDEGDGFDEAFVPVDYEQAQFLIDDDLRALLVKLPDGASLTCFIDCCHSGTITRVFGRTAEAEVPGMKARFLPLAPTSDVVRRYLAERAESRRAGTTRAFSDRTGLRWVNFSACDATEKAYEQNGNGDFTRLATGLLAAGAAGASNAEFQRRVVEAFGAARRQTPQLDCPPDAEGSSLFQYAAGVAAVEAAPPAAAPADTIAPEQVGALDRRAADRRAQRREESPGRRDADWQSNLDKLQDVAEWIVDMHS